MKVVGPRVYIRKISADGQSWVYKSKCKVCAKEHVVGLGSAFHITIETACKLASDLDQRVALGKCSQQTSALEKARKVALKRNAICPAIWIKSSMSSILQI